MFYVFYRKDSDINETCFYIESITVLDSYHISLLTQLLDAYPLNNKSFFKEKLLEYGPILNFETPWCSNVISICKKIGLSCIKRIEYSSRHYIMQKYDSTLQIEYKNTLKQFINLNRKNDTFPVKNIQKFSKDNDLNIDPKVSLYYQNYFRKRKRYPTNVELFDLAQSNSEHSRHWIFNGKLIFKNGNYIIKSLMDYIKLPLKKNKNNSVKAFCDNASAIKGFYIHHLNNDLQRELHHITFNAETHNFPTGIAPFQGATTGVGGRIRDTQCIGRGGIMGIGTAGYCVGKLKFTFDSLDPIDILLKASDGASDYGNKIGEPIILGFARDFGLTIKGQRWDWTKPIMFSGGLGKIKDCHVDSLTPKFGDLIVKIGGPAYRIGMGGGSASSKNITKIDDLVAVQRGDPQMENKLNRFLLQCIELNENNPIKNIHDQGAGGTANVTKEIIEPNGGIININNIKIGDSSMSLLELWCCEYQEQNTMIIHPKNIKLVKQLAKKEGISLRFIGYIDNSKSVSVYDSSESKFKYHVNLNLKEVLTKIPKQKIIMEKTFISSTLLHFPINHTFDNSVSNVLKLLAVGSKRFLTNKVDRSVGGLVAQQQCVGPIHTPISNYALYALSYFNKCGAVTTIGEKPIIGLINPNKMVRMAVGEMLTNMMGCCITRFNDIKCSGNWMWPAQSPKEKYHLYKAVRSLSSLLCKLKIAIDGGKDSLFMTTKKTKGPRQLVMSGYCSVDNIYKKVTPEFKDVGNTLFYIDFSKGKRRLGGSALAQTFNQIGTNPPDLDNYKVFKKVFNAIQKLIKKNLILSCHDISDGGLITTIIEMATAGNIGCLLRIKEDDIFSFFFAEELGIVIECSKKHDDYVYEYLNKIIPVYKLGYTILQKTIIIHNHIIIFEKSLMECRKLWEDTNFNLEKIKIDKKLAIEENELICSGEFTKYNIPVKVKQMLYEIHPEQKHNVIVLREEGSNGDKEMVAAFFKTGFNVTNLTTSELSENVSILKNTRGLIFVGGFTYSDVLGAAHGWYQIIKNNRLLHNALQNFKNRSDTFSLGVCNGCQLMSKLEWIPRCYFYQNISKRFESRFSTVKIINSPSIMLKNLENSIVGIWIAHSEGRFVPHSKIDFELCPIRYVNENGYFTTRYPMNPNGSIEGITAVCSKDGRHLAMMPHPERCFLDWQCPYGDKYSKQFWSLLFRNAYEWCDI